MARPRKLTKDELKQLEALVATGVTLDEIATYFEVCPKTIDNWVKRPDVITLYKKAKLKAKSAVGQTLFKKAVAGDLGAIIWYEKTRCGYSEKQVQEIITSQPIVNVNLPDETAG